MTDGINEIREGFTAVAQDWANAYDEGTKQPLNAQFPFGVIRTLNSITRSRGRERWPYLKPENKRTLACMIQLCDVNRFHLNTWKLGLTAGTVVEWHATVPVVSVIESLLVLYGAQNDYFSKDTHFKRAINILHSKGIIKHTLQERLHEIRKFRNDIHLHIRQKVKLHDGLPKRYNEACACLAAVEKALKTHHKADQ